MTREGPVLGLVCFSYKQSGKGARGEVMLSLAEMRSRCGDFGERVKGLCDWVRESENKISGQISLK